MDSLAFQALVSKLSSMAAATARVAAGTSAMGPAAAAAAATTGTQRGLRTAAAFGAALAGQQQPQSQVQSLQARQQRMAASQAMSSAASGFPLASSAQQQQRRQPCVNLAAAAKAPLPASLAAATRCSTPAAAAVLRHQASAPRRGFATAAAAQSAVDTQYDGSDPVGVGSLVEFERGKEYFLGRAIKQLAQGWQVEAASGTVYSVKHADIKFVLPGGAGYSAADLQAVAADVSRHAAEDDYLAMAWELAADDGPSTILTVPQMADLLFNKVTPGSCAAALRMLRDDRMYFKQAGRSPPMFSARSQADVRSLKQSLALQEQAEKEWGEFAAAIQAAQRQARPDKPREAAWQAGPHAQRLAAVEALALGDLPPAGPEYQLASKTLGDLGKSPSSQDAAELLQSIGWWEPHLQLNLLAAGVSKHFPEELEAEARALLASPPADPDAPRRRDFAAEGHAVVTIDDASTTEIDDGLSVERLPDGNIKVWVHIADPSRWVAPGTPLAEEAAARSKSLYLPTGVVPMFPKCLAEGPFSLRAGVPTEAVSVGAQVGPDGALLPHSVDVVPSRVAPARRLTYVDVDAMYDDCTPEEEPDLFELLELAQLRREHRLGAGATEIQMPEACVAVEGEHLEEPEVSISEEDQYSSLARQMVAEMMILAGEAVGELGRRLGVPLPYRGQAEPVLPEEDELAAVPPGPCQAVLLRQRMTRSVTATSGPVRHAGLGLEAYVQFTSPIRRYGDLLAHWQLKAVLRGEQAEFAAGQLSDVMDGVAATTQRLTKLERETESYWVAEYFRQVTKSAPRAVWGSTFLCWVKQDVGLGRVLLGGLGLETVVRVNTPVQPGETLFLRCSHTDVRMGMWRLDVVPSSQVSPNTLINASSYL